MTKQFTPDLKLKAVNYYHKINNYVRVCEIFECSERSLKRWVERYDKNKNVNRKTRNFGSYKLEKQHIQFIKETLRKHSYIQMNFLQELLKSKFPKLDISRQYLSDIIRDNNITRKRATFKHFPKTYRGNIRNEQQELKEFFDVINKFKLEDIISIDETSVSTSLTHNYCRAFLGDRCIKKTTNNEVFKKYSLVVAINNKKCISSELYQNGAVNAERFNEFLKKICSKVKGKLFVLDNGQIHKKETKMKKYNNIILAMKSNKIQEKTIIEYETELSSYKRKTLNIDKFKEYLQAKNRINHILFGFYHRELFRKLKFGRYINIKRNEQKMISNFKKIFGNPEDVVICIGDWEQKKQMKFKEPTLGIGIRTLFRKKNYKVFLVDEFRSSCKCSNCNGGLCEKFMIRKNPRPNKDDIRLVHGLLRCKSGCGLWNRDRNGSSNIYKIAEAAINKLERPNYLCREIKVITPLNRVWDKQTLHGNEKPNLENPSIYTEGGGFKSSRV